MDTLSWPTICLFVGVCYGLNTWDLPSSNLLSLVDPSMKLEWMMFKKTYNRTYKNDDEEIRRRLYFEDTIKFVADHNDKYARGKVCYNVSLNNFADVAEDEFRDIYMHKVVRPKDIEDYTEDLTERGSDANNSTIIPKSKDWRKEGVVSSVKDQGKCGSCWAFSAVGAIEGQHMIYNKTAVNLSAQFLVDCVKAAKNIKGDKEFNRTDGCEGGWMEDAFSYIRYYSKNIPLESCYEYTAEDGQCYYKSGKSSSRCDGASDNGYRGVTDKLAKDLAFEGPVSITMDANHRGFWFYNSGVYHEPNCTKTPTHAMLAVGYDTCDCGKCGNLTSYWIMKNSWGIEWGDKGYVKVARTDKDECGVLRHGVRPVYREIQKD